MQVKKEDILVVPRAVLEAQGLIGVVPGLHSLDDAASAHVQELVEREGLFLPRPAMEVDEAYKQIIPYMVLVRGDEIFVMARSARAGESRLASKITIGIGGHVRQEDMQDDGLVGWGMREFVEEVALAGGLARVKIIGLLNDDSDAVGRVHLGVVFVLTAKDDAEATIASELAWGRFMSREEAQAQRENMESWSRIVFDALEG